MKLLSDTVAGTWSDVVREEVGDRKHLAAGTYIGSWRIERVLGMGGMSSVYAVTHDQIGKRAALKVMHGRLSSGLNAERVTLEGRVVNYVGHANIVDIFDAGCVAGRPYLVMERLEGVTLTVFAGGKRVPLRTAIAILLQLQDALVAAHQAGVVHRDLKPENIFLIDRGDVMKPHVKVLDWGIAKVLDDTSRRTIQGRVIGTPDYLSPEQACGTPVSPMTDVYALGVIAYELFVGELPFQAADPTEMLMAHYSQKPRHPWLIWPEVPPRLAALLLWMLAKAPGERPSLDMIARELVLADAVLATMPCVCATPVEAPAIPSVLVAPGRARHDRPGICRVRHDTHT